MTTTDIANNPRLHINTTTRELIRARDWDAIAELWDTFRPDAHGIQRATIPDEIREPLRRAAAAEGVRLP